MCNFPKHRPTTTVWKLLMCPSANPLLLFTTWPRSSLWALWVASNEHTRAFTVAFHEKATPVFLAAFGGVNCQNGGHSKSCRQKSGQPPAKRQQGDVMWPILQEQKPANTFFLDLTMRLGPPGTLISLRMQLVQAFLKCLNFSSMEW